MKYATPAAFRAALDQRLKTEADRTGIGLARKRIACELFLRRLVKVAPSRWVLKGAFALDLRLDVATRPTNDIDIGRDDDTDAAIEDMTATQQLDLGDFISFAATRTTAFDETDEFTAVRFHVRAELAGRIFEQFIVDIGFTDRITWTPDTITTSNLLEFADIAPIEVPAVPLAQHVAEKVHAYTRRYGTQQQPSTRPKDLVDILLISGSEPMDAAALREALERTFEQRARQPLPEALPAPPDSCRRPFALLASEVGIDPNLAAAFRHCSGLSRPGARQADVGAMGSGRHAVAAQPYDVMGGTLELAPSST